MESGRSPREYSREMRGDPVPQNFTDGVCPRGDERAMEVPDADEVAERSRAGRGEEEREEPRARAIPVPVPMSFACGLAAHYRARPRRAPVEEAWAE